MHADDRKINLPRERGAETQIKKTMDIMGVMKENAWIELRNATKKALPKAVRHKITVYLHPSNFFPLMRIIEANVTKHSI